MPLDELTDEQLDRRLRELLPPSPRSRTWERAQRERLINYITTAHTDFPSDPSTLDEADLGGQLVELVSRQSERPRGWWTVGTAAAAVVLVVGLFAMQRVADAPAPTQQPGTTTRPTTPDRYSTTEEVLDDFDRIERAVGQHDASRQTRFYTTYFDCMATEGFDVPPEVRPTVKTPLASLASTRDVRASLAFEQAPRSAIAEHGYDVAGLTAETEDPSGEPIADDPLSQWIATLSPDQQAAYAVADMGGPDAPIIEYSDDVVGSYSMPATGCNYLALQAAHGDVDTWFRASTEINLLRGLVITGALDSDTYRSALDNWARCLAANAVRLDNPHAMSGSIEQAVADRDCRDQAELGGARNETLLTTANEYRDRLRELVDDADTLANPDTQ